MTESYGPETDLPALERRMREVEARLVSGQSGLEDVNSEVSGWSPIAHLFHLALANELSLKNAMSLHQRHGRLIRDPEDVQETAAELLRVGTIPRGHTAPRFVTPPKHIDMEVLLDLVQGNRALIGDLEPMAGELKHAPRTIPHQLVGDLNAVQWVRFARVHTDHHWSIVGQIDQALRT